VAYRYRGTWAHSEIAGSIKTLLAYSGVIARGGLLPPEMFVGGQKYHFASPIIHIKKVFLTRMLT